MARSQQQTEMGAKCAQLVTQGEFASDSEPARGMNAPVRTVWLGARRWKRVGGLLGGAIAGMSCGLGLGTVAIAQPVPSPQDLAQVITPAQDGTGTQVRVSPEGDRFTIDGGQRSADGSNLFHSFDRLGLGADQVADFVADPSLSRILGRVTGGEASLIDGLLRVSGGTADLYLMNPAGIVFGSTARLDVPGAFAATTATGIGFGDTWFPAVGAVDWRSLVGSPTGFRFDGTAIGSVVNLGTLAVGAGSEMILAGGVLANGGTIAAPGGQVILAAVPGNHWLRLSVPGSPLSLDIVPVPGWDPIATGIDPLSLPVLLAGQDPDRTLRVDPTGRVVIAAADPAVPAWSLTPQGGDAIASGTVTTANPRGLGGTVAIAGNRAIVAAATVDATGDRGGGTVLIGGDRAGQGSLSPARQTLITADSTVDASATGQGAGGTVILWSEDATVMAGAIAARGNGGDGGFVEVSGRSQLQVTGAIDVGATAGRSGTILLDPENILIVDPLDDTETAVDVTGTDVTGTDVTGTDVTGTDATGDNPDQGATNLDPLGASTNLDQLLLNGGVIRAGDALGESVTITTATLGSLLGNVTLEATNDITIAGGVSLIFEDPGTTETPPTVTFRADADGNGAGSFTMDPGEQLVATNRNLVISGAAIAAGDLTTRATLGPAGSIQLTATNGGISAAGLDTTSEAGAAGRVDVTATGDLDLGDVLTFTSGSGRGGDVALTSSSGGIVLDFGFTGSTDGDAGNFNATAVNDIVLTELNTTALGAGTGGSIGVRSQAGRVEALQLDASSQGGLGGAIGLAAATEVRLESATWGSVAGLGIVDPDAEPTDPPTPTNGALGIETPGIVNWEAVDLNPNGAEIILGAGTPIGSWILPEVLFLNGGNLAAAVAGDYTVTEDIVTGGGDFQLTAAGNVTVSSAIASQGGAITLTGANVQITGLLDASGVADLATAEFVDSRLDGGTVTLRALGGAIAPNNSNTLDPTEGLTQDPTSGDPTGGNPTGGNPTGGNPVATNPQLNNGVITATTLRAAAPSGTGGNLVLDALGSITTGDLDASGATGGGEITATSVNGAIALGNLDVSSSNGPGGTVTLTAGGGLLTEAELATLNAVNFVTDADGLEQLVMVPGPFSGEVTVGNIDASGVTGGTVEIQAETRITGGTLAVQGTQLGGGTVFLDPRNDVDLTWINAEGGPNGGGGEVAIAADRFIRLRGNFLDRDRNQASISTAGGAGSGTIALEHGGTPFNQPFVVRDPTLPPDQAVTVVVSSDLPAADTPNANGTDSPATSADPNNPDASTLDPNSSDPNTAADPTATDTANGNLLGTVTDLTISRRGVVNGTFGVINNGNPAERIPRTGAAQEAFLGPLVRGETSLLTDGVDVDSFPDSGDDLGDLGDLGQSGGNRELVQSLVPQGVTDGVQADLDEARPSTLWARQEITRRAGDREAEPVLAEVDWQGTGRDREVWSKLDRIERLFTEDYLNYLGLSETINADIPATQETLRQIEADTGIRPALLYAVFRDRFGEGDPEQAPLELFLVTSNDAPLFLTRLDAPRKTVLEAASQLRATLTNPLLRTSDRYLVPAQQLYDWLVRPLLPTLRSRQIDNIAIIGDTGLRSVPFAALHDGEAFVIQEFSLGLMPSLALVDTRYRNLSTAPVLALGASEFTSLDPLPAVPVELELLTTRLRNGEVLLNDAFTLTNLQAAQTRISSQIIHLATHAEFRAGDARESYIQLGNDERLPLDTMRNLGWDDPVVDLLVLSACRTALGDDQAELGFGGMAVAAGVKTAIASLWYVSDSGTLGLMSEFYTWLSRSPIKAEALRQAQLAMSRGEVRIEGSELVGEFGRVPLPPVLQIDGTLELSHPYFWSAFTAIGSPY